MRKHDRYLHFLFALFPFLGIRGQVSLHTFDQFGPAQGLTEAVHNIAQDSDGFLWIGTDNGLFRFDGVQAIRINYMPSDTLHKHSLKVKDLCFDPQKQTLWIGTGHGVFRYHLPSGQTFQFFPEDLFEKRNLDNPDCPTIFTDRQGETWANFGVQGLVHLPENGQKAEVFYLPLNEREKAAGLDERLANHPMMIAQDANDDHILWIPTKRGLLRFNKTTKRLQRYILYTNRKGMLLATNSMTCVFPHKNGFVYIGSWDAGVLRFDPATETFTQFFPNKTGWSNVNKVNRVYWLLPAGENHIWVKCNQGSLFFDVEKGKFTTEYTPGFSLDFRDRSGNYWQFKDGLRLFHHFKNQFVKYPLPEFVQCSDISGLPFDSVARQVFIRASCQNGLWAMNVDDFTWKRYELPGESKGNTVLVGYCQTPDGFLISNRIKQLFFRPNGVDRFQRLPVVFPEKYGNLTFTSRKDGQIFVTGNEGWLAWFKPGSWRPTIYDKSNVRAPNPNFFTSMGNPYIDRLGKLWIKTSGGLSVFSPEENKMVHISKTNGEGEYADNYLHFSEDENNRLWVFGDATLGWFDTKASDVGMRHRFKNFEHLNIKVGFIRKEKVWLSSADKLMEFDPKTEIIKLYPSINTTNIALIGNDKGIALWEKEFGIFHLDSLATYEEAPKPCLAWFKVFEKPRQLMGNPFYPEKINLRSDENFFSFGFSALAWYNPGQIRFAFKLEGINQDWVYLEQGTLSTSFSNVKGGDYVLKVKTTNSQGEWLDNIYELNIHLETPWWETLWFQLAILFLFGAVVYYFVTNRLKQQKIILENQRLQIEKERSLRNERDRIAAEMHDDLGAGLSTIRFLSLVAKEKETDPANASRIDKIARQATQVMEKMADIIWVMNSRNDTIENFAAYLRWYAAELMELHHIRLSFDLMTDLPDLKLSGEQRRTLLLAVKECLHNVVKHSGVTEMKLSVHVDRNLEISIQDNGKGFPLTKLTEAQEEHNTLISNGLRNINQRMKALGGEAVFENDHGAKVTLLYPVTSV